MSSSHFFDRSIEDTTMKEEKKNIGENPQSRIQGLDSLKQKLSQIEGLKPQLNDEFLLRFLRVAKFDAKKACERLKKYYSVRKTYSHVLKEFYPSAAKTCPKAGRFLASPQRNKDHSIVFVMKTGTYDPSTMVYEDVFLMDCLVLDFMSENPITQVCGAHYVIDFAGYGFQQFINATPSRIRMAVDIMQNTIPLRCKSVHIINASRIFSLLYTIFYPIITMKIRKRFFIHKGKDWKDFHSALSPELLSEDYGGTIPASDMIDLTVEVMKRESQYKEEHKYGFIEKS